MALPTNGHVVIETTVGELDIELWCRVSVLVLRVFCSVLNVRVYLQETPKTCRNFLTLAMEGGYWENMNLKHI